MRTGAIFTVTAFLFYLSGVLFGQQQVWNKLERLNKTDHSTIWRYREGPIICYIAEAESQPYGGIVIPSISCVGAR